MERLSPGLKPRFKVFPSLRPFFSEQPSDMTRCGFQNLTSLSLFACAGVRRAGGRRLNARRLFRRRLALRRCFVRPQTAIAGVAAECSAARAERIERRFPLLGARVTQPSHARLFRARLRGPQCASAWTDLCVRLCVAKGLRWLPLSVYRVRLIPMIARGDGSLLGAGL